MSSDAPERAEPTAVKIEAWARLIRVAQTLLGAVEADLRAKNFPPLAWFDALLELNRAGASGLRPYQLQDEMLLAQYNLSRLIDRLEAADYVARVPCPEDGRGHRVTLAAGGRQLLRRMWPAYRAAIAAHFGGKLTEQEARTLSALLHKVEEANP